jgi:hypothetical protein
MYLPHSWSILIGLLVVVLASVAAWVFAPKGENQTYVSLLPRPTSISHEGYRFAPTGYILAWNEEMLTYVTIGYGDQHSC